MKDIKSLTKEELTTFVTEELNQPKYRADQLFDWMHRRMESDVSQMTNLPKSLRAALMEKAELRDVHRVTMQQSKDGTQKYLFALMDQNRIESVRMKYKYGSSVCISSQAGCRMGCTFCASTMDGLSRSLTASEMLSQVYRISKDLGERISHVVVMGMGEPLDNYEELLRFLRLISDPAGQNISQRNLTVSTCGIVPGILALAEERLQITLALSLHAATQEKRRKLMPVANKYELSEVIRACDIYFQKTGRRVTYEYSLIAGENDTEEDVRALSILLKDKNCHVNLIPVNPVRSDGYKQPAQDAVIRFKNKLEKNGINSTIRRGMGRDIDGACGQLRARQSRG